MNNTTIKSILLNSILCIFLIATGTTFGMIVGQKENQSPLNPEYIINSSELYILSNDGKYYKDGDCKSAFISFNNQKIKDNQYIGTLKKGQNDPFTIKITGGFCGNHRPKNLEILAKINGNPLKEFFESRYQKSQSKELVSKPVVVIIKHSNDNNDTFYHINHFENTIPISTSSSTTSTEKRASSISQITSDEEEENEHQTENCSNKDNAKPYTDITTLVDNNEKEYHCYLEYNFDGSKKTINIYQLTNEGHRHYISKLIYKPDVLITISKNKYIGINQNNEFYIIDLTETQTLEEKTFSSNNNDNNRTIHKIFGTAIVIALFLAVLHRYDKLPTRLTDGFAYLLNGFISNRLYSFAR